MVTSHIHPFLVKLGVVCYCFNHMNEYVAGIVGKILAGEFEQCFFSEIVTFYFSFLIGKVMVNN
jgi:hypothetical protein